MDENDRFADKTVDELIAAFNREVGNPGWVRARAIYLTGLRRALLATGLDCSSFIRDDGMSLAKKIEQVGSVLQPVNDGA